jgi:hypothetical protein
VCAIGTDFRIGQTPPLRQIESIQVRGSEDVTRVEHLLEKGRAVDWADVQPATVLSVFVRGVRALPKSARVFSGDRDFKRLQKALRASDKIEGLANVRQKLDPKKRDLLQVSQSTFQILGYEACMCPPAFGFCGNRGIRQIFS